MAAKRNPFTETSEWSAHFPRDANHATYVQRPDGSDRRFSDPAVLTRLGIGYRNGTPWQNLIIREHRPLYITALKQIERGGGNFRLQYRVTGNDQRKVDVFDYFGAVELPDGSKVLAGCILLERNLYTQSHRTERLALVGRLVGGLVHDFKNMLAGIQSVVEWCSRQPELEQEVADALRRTVDYTDDASALINSIFGLISGRALDTAETFDASQAVADLADIIRHVTSTAITVNFDLAAGLPPVYGQRGIFQDMLLNLCLNARDAMAENGGELRVAVSAPTTPKQVCVAVSDTGCGLGRREMESIFRAFESSKDRGTGLGLWMVREAAMAFGAKLQVESEPGVGTTFSIYLPVSQATAVVTEPVSPAAAPAAKAPAPQPGDATVLLVEDDPLLRNAVLTWLKTLGYTVLAAEDGDTAWRLFQEHTAEIDVIILDLILPGSRRGEPLLRAFIAEKAVPIIVTSGHADSEQSQWVRDRGGYAFLSKPFKIDALLALIEASLAERN